MHGLAESRWRPDDRPTALGGHDHGLEAGQAIQGEVFHAALGVREQLADELGSGGPWRHLE